MVERAFRQRARCTNGRLAGLVRDLGAEELVEAVDSGDYVVDVDDPGAREEEGRILEDLEEERVCERL